MTIIYPLPWTWENVSKIEQSSGLDRVVVKIVESIFEGLSLSERMDFFKRMGRNTNDFVHWLFLCEILPTIADCEKVLNIVRMMSVGENAPVSALRSRTGNTIARNIFYTAWLLQIAPHSSNNRTHAAVHIGHAVRAFNSSTEERRQQAETLLRILSPVKLTNTTDLYK